MDIFLKSIPGDLVTATLVPIDCKENGTIEQHSYRNLQKLTSTKLQAIVVIFDIENVQHLFDAVGVIFIKSYSSAQKNFACTLYICTHVCLLNINVVLSNTYWPLKLGALKVE